MMLAEQKAAIRAACRGMSFSIQAVAGSGKTTTLRAIAEARPGPILYLAFNKAIVEEARQRLPSGVEVCTLHSLAYRQVVRGKMREKVRPLSPQQLVKLLGIKEKAGISAYGLGILVNRLLTQIILGKPATCKFIEDGEPMAVLDGLERGGQGKHCLFATAHQAKGLEWDHIVLGDDFRSSSQEEMNLHYVALTRARRLCENLPSEKGGKK